MRRYWDYVPEKEKREIIQVLKEVLRTARGSKKEMQRKIAEYLGSKNLWHETIEVCLCAHERSVQIMLVAQVSMARISVGVYGNIDGNYGLYDAEEMCNALELYYEWEVEARLEKGVWEPNTQRVGGCRCNNGMCREVTRV